MIGRRYAREKPRIGQLRQRVLLEAPVLVADGGGGASVTWSTVAEIWAGIDPVTGSEQVVAEAISARVSHEILIRHRADIDTSMRFRLDARRFGILAVLDIDERRRMLRCLCREELP